MLAVVYDCLKDLTVDVWYLVALAPEVEATFILLRCDVAVVKAKNHCWRRRLLLRVRLRCWRWWSYRIDQLRCRRSWRRRVHRVDR